MSRNRKIAVCAISVGIAVTLAFIFTNSLLNQSQSTDQSQTVYNFMYKIMYAIFKENASVITHSVFRSMAHFAEFFVLGAEASALFVALKKFNFKSLIIILPSGLGVALIDELLQLITDRAFQITDILLDFSGYFIATAITYLIIYIYNKNKAKKASKNPPESENQN